MSCVLIDTPLQCSSHLTHTLITHRNQSFHTLEWVMSLIGWDRLTRTPAFSHKHMHAYESIHTLSHFLPCSHSLVPGVLRCLSLATACSPVLHSPSLYISLHDSLHSLPRPRASHPLCTHSSVHAHTHTHTQEDTEIWGKDSRMTEDQTQEMHMGLPHEHDRTQLVSMLHSSVGNSRDS